MKHSDVRRFFARTSRLCLCAAALYAAACEKIFEGEGDCTTIYQVAFSHTKNIAENDAFSSRVKSIALFVFDQNGNFVSAKADSGPQLASDNYLMTLDILPGNYDLVAWGGLEQNNAFELVSQNPKNKNELICKLKRDYDQQGNATSQKQLDDLFYGNAQNVVCPTNSGIHTVANIDLMKDNNTVHVVLQHFNGGALDKDLFSFVISDNNGTMNSDNSLLDDEYILYREWAKNSVPAQSTVSSRADADANSVVADIDVARFVKEGHDPVLSVYYTAKESPILSVRIIDLLLAAKGDALRPMSDQEYLDRQDDYTLVFFIDDYNQWYKSLGIYVNSWHVIIADYDM